MQNVYLCRFPCGSFDIVENLGRFCRFKILSVESTVFHILRVFIPRIKQKLCELSLSIFLTYEWGRAHVLNNNNESICLLPSSYFHVNIFDVAPEIEKPFRYFRHDFNYRTYFLCKWINLGLHSKYITHVWSHWKDSRMAMTHKHMIYTSCI